MNTACSATGGTGRKMSKEEYLSKFFGK